MHQKVYYVYILTDALKTVLYTGMTHDLLQRITGHYKHRGQQTSFTSKYNVHYLFWFESHPCINNAIAREKEIKGWRREKKMKLIARMNPGLRFLNEKVFGKWPPEELTERG